MIAPQQAASTPFQSASLYVGDLHNEVTESLLFELFNRVGPVASIRVCRDSVTRRSLGYAYVNFHNVQDAERSLDTMNFTEIKARPCRIMWSQRDPSLRKSGVGNVFVRNLAPSVDNKGLYDTFSVFGNILSCKVATDENGVSKGYGYVHFETAEAAQDAIQKFNGTLIDDIEVHVGTFVKRQDRAGQADWTNLYVKQFPVTWDENRLKDLFGTYGQIANVAITRDAADGTSKGFGFVNFSEHDAAVKALAELANKVFPLEDGAVPPPSENGEEPKTTFELYVSRAQKKNERTREIKTRLDALNQEKLSKYQGMNLYVKNIADTITDDGFREAFAPYGTITSARIMKDPADTKISKGFGFICYSSPEEATRAVTEMNGKVIGNKPLVVTLHQRKEHRRAHLAATYAPQNMGGMNMRFPQNMGMGQNPMAPYMGMGMYMPQQGGVGAQGGGQGGFQNNRPGPGMGGGAYPYPMGGRGGVSPRGMGGFPQQQGQGQGPPGNRQGFFPPNGNGPQQQPPYLGQGQMQGQNQGPMGRNPTRPMGPGQGPPNSFPGQMGQQGQGQGMVRRPPSNGMQGPGGPMGGMQGPGGPMGGGMGGRPGPGGPMGGMQGPGPMGGRPNMPGQGYPGPMQQQQQQNRPGGPGMVKFNNQVRNQMQPMGMGMGGPQMMPPQMQQQQPPHKPDFSDAALASADPLTQKNMIGEHLYPLIYNHQPEQAGKITGMLLEMDNGELLNLIESPDALMSKIDEALNVLRNHKSSAEE